MVGVGVRRAVVKERTQRSDGGLGRGMVVRFVAVVGWGEGVGGPAGEGSLSEGRARCEELAS